MIEGMSPLSLLMGYPMYYSKGFTLIELMISVAIIGILVAIALPAYQDYLKRSHVLEGLQLASRVKFSVYEYYYHKGQWPLDNVTTDLPLPSSITGNAVNSVSIQNGKIIITYNTAVGFNQNITLTPTINSIGSINWDCKTNSTVPAKYRPQSCR